MKRICVFLLILSTLLLGGCGGEVDRIFYPAGNDVELYYDSYTEVRTQIKRDDIKRGDYYDDIFLAEGVEQGMTLGDVLFTDKREAMLEISSTNEALFIPGATGHTKLTEWINGCSKVRYTFDKQGSVSTYELTNTNNTYIDYLYVMRALSLKYGECTTEIYKDGDNIINNTKIREDYKDIDSIVAFFESEFSKGNVEIISQWVEDDYVLSVEFLSPENGKVVYSLKEPDTTEKMDTETVETDENEQEEE